MKAVVWSKYGPPEVLQYKEIETPSPSEKEVLIKIHATTVNLGDCEIRGSYLPLWTRIPLKLFFGVFKPRGTKILGMECAGEIAEIGSNVSQFKVGDRVVVNTGLSLGSNAQYLVLSETSNLSIIEKIPDNISYKAATTLPVGGVNALYFLNVSNLKTGDKILINGAGGSIGTYAVQIAKLAGAKITAVDISEKFDMLRTLGANTCIDFRDQDFTKMNQTYDVIFDIVGKASLRWCKKSLNRGGIYLSANPMLNTMIRSKLYSIFTDKTFIAGVASEESKFLRRLLDMLQEDAIRPWIDKEFQLHEIIKAHQYVEANKKQGHVIINVEH